MQRFVSAAGGWMLLPAALGLATLGLASMGGLAVHEARAQQPAGGDAVAQFNATFEQWKKLLDELRQIRADYKLSRPDERPKLEERWNTTLAEVDRMLPTVSSQAEAAFKADPQQTDIADFLGSVADAEFEKDNYEESLRIAEVLISGNYQNSDIYRIAGLSALESTQLDKAEQYLSEAEAQKALGDQGRETMARLATERRLWAEEKAIRDAEQAPEDESQTLPRIRIQTNRGDMVVELFENEAPNTVANFVSLAEKKFYDGVTFHRVLPGFMAQGGDPDGTGMGGPGYKIKCEVDHENARKHFRGSLSMAHAGRDTGGSQFFITFKPTRHLDGRHTVFGRVVEGVEVLAKLQRRDPQDANPAEPDKIIAMEVLRKRDHEYKPVKVGDPVETPATETPATEKPATEKPEGDKPANDKPAEEQPEGDAANNE